MEVARSMKLEASGWEALDRRFAWVGRVLGGWLSEDGVGGEWGDLFAVCSSEASGLMEVVAVTELRVPDRFADRGSGVRSTTLVTDTGVSEAVDVRGFGSGFHSRFSAFNLLIVFRLSLGGLDDDIIPWFLLPLYSAAPCLSATASSSSGTVSPRSNLLYSRTL